MTESEAAAFGSMVTIPLSFHYGMAVGNAVVNGRIGWIKAAFLFVLFWPPRDILHEFFMQFGLLMFPSP